MVNFLKTFFFSAFLVFNAIDSYASVNVKFSDSISKDTLRIIKRMEYKEGIPNGLLHAISLVETNLGQTDHYRPWPYTIRLNNYKSKKIDNIDDAFSELDKLIDLGYNNFDLTINDNVFYSLSSVNLEGVLLGVDKPENIFISARSVIKYFETKKEASVVLNKLVKQQWFDFKVGVMQLDYDSIKNKLKNITDSLNTYDNIVIMVSELKKIRTQYPWWESVGMYHSEQQIKAKRYVKNVWSMYQRVHKIQVR